MITQKQSGVLPKHLNQYIINKPIKKRHDLHNATEGNFREQKKIALPLQNEIVFVPICNISGFEADRNYTTIHLKSGKKYTVCQTLKSFEEKLTSFLFVRLNRTWMVNMKFIERYCKKEKRVIMESGLSICVSQNRDSKFLDCIKNQFFLW